MLTVSNQVSVLFILIIVGFTIRRLKVIDNSLNSGLINFILYVALPSLAISSMSIEFSSTMLVNSGMLLLISIGIYAFVIILSIFISLIFKVDEESAGVYRFCTIFSNVGFMGYPVVNALYGKMGVFYTVMYNLPFGFLIWTLGVVIVGKMEKDRIEYKNIINPGITAAIIGLIIFLFSIKLPWPVFRTLKMLGDTATPLIMIVVGSILANVDISTVYKDIRVFGISLLRFVVLPVIALFSLKLIGLEHILVAIPGIITAMPAAANTSVYAEKYGGDAAAGAKIVINK